MKSLLASFARRLRTPVGRRVAPRHSRRPLTVLRLDDRVLPSLTPVTPVAGTPLMGVVDLQVRYADGATAVGSGALIDNSHVLTAAHLLYSSADGGYATSITVSRPADHPGQALPTAQGLYERVDSSWLGFAINHPGFTSTNVEDVGLVTLNRALGTSKIDFSVSSKAASSYVGARFETAGYPEANTSARMVTGSAVGQGLVHGTSVQFGRSDLNAVPGQSGSPIWQTSKGHAVVFGVVTGTNGYGANDQVFASAITPSVLKEIKAWEASNHGATAVGATGVAHSSAVSGQRMSSVPLDFELSGWGWQVNAGPGSYSSNGGGSYGGWGYGNYTGYTDGSLQWTGQLGGYPIVGSVAVSPYSTTVGAGLGWIGFNGQATYSVPYGYQNLGDLYNDAYGWANDTYNSLSNAWSTVNSPDYWNSYADPFGSGMGYDSW